MNTKHQMPWIEDHQPTAGQGSGASGLCGQKMVLPGDEISTFPAQEGGCHAVIENVVLEIDAGCLSIKRAVGETVAVEADIFAEEPDSLSAVLKFSSGENSEWTETPMEFLANGRWGGKFIAATPGNWFYIIEAWVNPFKSWRQKIQRKLQARQNISIELQAGAALIETAARRATALEAEWLRAWAEELRAGESPTGSSLVQHALDESLAELMSRHPDRNHATTYEKELSVVAGTDRAPTPLPEKS